MTETLTPRPGGIAGRWGAVRALLLVLALAFLAAAALVHPGFAARYLSSDGEFSARSLALLRSAQVFFLLLAAGAAFLWRRWQSWTPTRARVLTGSALLLASGVVSLAALEGGLAFIHRFVKPLDVERHYFFTYDPMLGWKHRAGSVAMFKNSIVRLDRDGLRVARADAAPRSSTVLVLGDSQAFGDGVSAEQTFGELVAGALPDVRVLNSAVIGYGTDQELLYFEDRGARFSPDVTLVALNAYDLSDNLTTRIRSGYRKPRFSVGPDGLVLDSVPGEEPLVDHLQRELQQRSHLYRLSTRLLRRPGQRDDDEAAPATRQGIPDVYPAKLQLERAFQVTGAILDRFARRAQEAGGRLLVLFLPYEMDFSGPPAYRATTDTFVQKLDTWAGQSGFTLLDTRDALRGSEPHAMFLDTMHFSPEGHRRVAAALTQTLVTQHLLAKHHDQ